METQTQETQQTTQPAPSESRRQKGPPVRNAKLDNWGRPCLVTDIDYKNGNQQRTRQATFHVWGYQRFAKPDGPPAMQTVAVVELEDGRITTKKPDCITFLDRGQQAQQANQATTPPGQ